MASVPPVDPYRWSWDADALVVIPGMAAAYAIALTRLPAPRWRVVCFGAGCALMLAVQITPLDTLALHYLLVMHLLQNVVLAEWGPLLIVIGLTPRMAREIERVPGARTLTHPLVALPIWLAVYYAWHLPAAYDAALRHQWTILHLEHATSIPPAVPLSLADEQIGRAMVSIGYGMFSPEGDEDERRRIGSETVAAVRGRLLEPMFGSFESYVEWSLTGEVTDFNYLQVFSPRDFLGQLLLQSLRSDFDSQLLLDGYEAVTGRQPGDSQSCKGDSGGPLALQTEDGSWQTYGVVSGGLYSAHSVCDYGSVFATFGPDTAAFLARAQSWLDPCAEVPARGECRGSVAVRCETGLLEGRRNLVLLPCAEREQECFLGTRGAECHEPLPSSVGASVDSDAGTPATSAADAGTPPGEADSVSDRAP